MNKTEAMEILRTLVQESEWPRAAEAISILSIHIRAAESAAGRWAALTRLVERYRNRCSVNIFVSSEVCEIRDSARLLGSGPTLDAALDDAVAKDSGGGQ